MARCKISDCNNLAVYGTLCARHKVYENANKKHNESKFIKYPWQHLYYTNTWKKLRAMHLSGHPTCVMCKYPGDQVDHIIDHHGDRGLFFDALNLQTLCRSCHTKKTFEDNAFHKLPSKDDMTFTFNLVPKKQCLMLKMSVATRLVIDSDHIYKLLAKDNDNIFNLSSKIYIMKLYKVISKGLKYKPKVKSNSEDVLKILERG